MKQLFLIFAVLAFLSCKEKSAAKKQIDYTGFREESFLIIGIDSNINHTDTLGNVCIQVPFKLDTCYQWIDHSDCTNCGHMYYRFASKKYCLNKDFTGGLNLNARHDSFYQVSVKIKPFPEFKNDYPTKHKWESDLDDFDELTAYWNHTDSLTDLWGSPYKRNWTKRGIEIINSRKFSVQISRSNSSAYHVDLKRKYSSSNFPYKIEVEATTILDDRRLIFHAICDGLDTAGFAETVYKSLLSLRYTPKDQKEIR